MGDEDTTRDAGDRERGGREVEPGEEDRERGGHEGEPGEDEHDALPGGVGDESGGGTRTPSGGIVPGVVPDHLPEAPSVKRLEGDLESDEPGQAPVRPKPPVKPPPGGPGE